MVEFLKGLSVSQILQYYAVMSLALMPLNILLLYLLNKYTDLVVRFDRFLDGLIGRKDDGGRGADVRKDASDGGEGKETERKEEMAELSGISCFSLPVGQVYHCRQNSQGRSSGMYELRWFSSNEFIGKVDGDAVFTALKAGTVDVYCARKNDDYDQGAHAYRITVLPRDGKWPVQKVIDLLLARAERRTVLEAFMDSKILRDDPVGNVIEYRQCGSFEKITLQFDRTGRLERTVYLLKTGKDCSARIPEGMVSELDDRFEEIPLITEGGIRLWIHRFTDEEHDEVDVYAYMRESMAEGIRGRRVLCIGQTWREYGEIDEFLLNIRMAEKMFSGILPGEEPIPVEAHVPAGAERKKVVEPVQGPCEETDGGHPSDEPTEPDDGDIPEPPTEEPEEVGSPDAPEPVTETDFQDIYKSFDDFKD